MRRRVNRGDSPKRGWPSCSRTGWCAGPSGRILFKAFAEDHYLPHAKVHKRSWRTDQSRIAWLVGKLGPKRLDEITAQDVDGLLLELCSDREPGTVNRYRDLLSAMFKRALRDGYVPRNPVKGVSKLKEPAGRVAYLLGEEERAVYDALAPAFRPHFLVSIHTGLRYGEQLGLRWRDVDMLTGLITIQRTKNTHGRQIPMNSVVRCALADLGSQRKRPDDPSEYVFDPRPVQSKSLSSGAP